MTVAAGVLAAGGGTRFEGAIHKLLAILDNKPIIVHVVDAVLAAGFDEVLVATGAADLSPHLPASVTEVPVPDWSRGQGRSLHALIEGARRGGHDRLVVGLGDQPGVGPAAWRSVGAGRGPIVTATFDGHRSPPVKLEHDVWDLIDTDGDEGARTLMRSRPDLVREVPCFGNPADIDRIEDLISWS